MPRKKQDPEIESRIEYYNQRLRDLRTDNDLTQTQVAEILHVSQRTYSDYELGNLRIPVEVYIELAKYYNVDMNYICGLTNIKTPFPGNWT